MKRKLTLILAFLGVANCVFVPFLFTASIQQPFFPLPGLYFIEIALLGLMGLVSVVRDPSEASTGWGIVPWIASGILLAFNILGAWTIGFFLIPGTLCFFGVGFLLTEKQSQKTWRGMGWFLISAIAQGVVMLALVNIL